MSGLLAIIRVFSGSFYIIELSRASVGLTQSTRELLPDMAVAQGICLRAPNDNRAYTRILTFLLGMLIQRECLQPRLLQAIDAIPAIWSLAYLAVRKQGQSAYFQVHVHGSVGCPCGLGCGPDGRHTFTRTRVVQTVIWRTVAQPSTTRWTTMALDMAHTALWQALGNLGKGCLETVRGVGVQLLSANLEMLWTMCMETAGGSWTALVSRGRSFSISQAFPRTWTHV